MNKLGIIIPAGGAGARMGGGGGEEIGNGVSALPKQFMQLGGKPVLAHAINAFRQVSTGAEIVVVLPQAHTGTWDELRKTHNVPPHKVCIGGDTRCKSVLNGLRALSPDCEYIAVHDGARPLVTPELILRTLETAREHGSAVPAIKIADSIRRITDIGISHPENRDELRAIQTPQVFRADILREAYQEAFERADCQQFTDDAALVEAAGYNVALCEGERRNIKITEPDDLKIAEALI